MKTLKEIVIARKARKGPADGVTKDGAYWVIVGRVINTGGGDGIGQSGADITYRLVIRHYRSGEIRAYLKRDAWHQNSGTHTEKTRADDLLDCSTIEELRAAIARHTISSDYGPGHTCAVSDYYLQKNLIPGLPEMPEMVAAPDEV